MPVENVNYPGLLDPDSFGPFGTDHPAEGDNHIQMIKRILKNTFGNVLGEVVADHLDLSLLAGLSNAGVTNEIMRQLVGLATDRTLETRLAALEGDEGLSLDELWAALELKADIESPTLTGVPKAPTPANGDSSTQIATTAFVQAVAAGAGGGTAVGGWTSVAQGNIPTNTTSLEIDISDRSESIWFLGIANLKADSSTTFYLDFMENSTVRETMTLGYASNGGAGGTPHFVQIRLWGLPQEEGLWDANFVTTLRGTAITGEVSDGITGTIGYTFTGTLWTEMQSSMGGYVVFGNPPSVHTINRLRLRCSADDLLYAGTYNLSGARL